MALVRACRVDGIPRGQTRFFRLNGTPVVIANQSGEFYALAGLCGHRGLPLDGASLWDYRIDCPWHHFQYDVRTGENHYPKNVYPADLPELQSQLKPLRTFRVEIRDGELWVELP